MSTPVSVKYVCITGAQACLSLTLAGESCVALVIAGAVLFELGQCVSGEWAAVGLMEHMYYSGQE